MRTYDSLFRMGKDQPLDTVFGFFPAVDGDYDAPFQRIARNTWDGYDAWTFHQERFIKKYTRSAVPKLMNYLNYTFIRLLELDLIEPGRYFCFSADRARVCFNTGLQNEHQSDLIATFQKGKPNPRDPDKPITEWVFRGCHAPSDYGYRMHFPPETPDIAWYSTDSRDYIFDTRYRLDRDVFDHLFDRAKERAGMPHVADEVVRNYLRGTIENLVPKIRRNYKLAIPVYYVREKRMQMLLPFPSAGVPTEYASFLVERDDANSSYHLKTIFDLDQAYFSARLITRPDREWLDP